LERRQAELQFAEEFHKRASRLHELKAGSLQQVQEAETKRRGAETFLEIAKAGLERAVNHLRYLGLTPEQLPGAAAEHAGESQGTHEEVHLIEVRSPVSGTIIDRMVSRGAVVTPSDSLYVISDLSRLWVIAEVPEQHLSSLRRGLGVDVSVRAYPGKTFPGRITYVSDSLDPETRTVEVRCELNNPGRQLKTEMFATLKIFAGSGKEAIVAPLSALQNVDGEEVLFVPEGEGSFRVRRVQVGQRTDSVAEIVSGLQPGEKVVVAGAFHLKSELLKAQMIAE
jgi:cobalt-zinc-cadmium efflux system membrane fusion protein